MFTGIVQGISRVSNVIDFENGRKLCLKLNELAVNLSPGSSIAVNGVCLTVVCIW